MWRVIIDQKREGTLNMGIDEALMEIGGNCLRIYGWIRPTVTIGRLQKVQEAVNIKECERRGIEVIRRISGGGSVIHDMEITYCIVGDKKVLGKSPKETFDKVLRFLMDFLRKLGIEGVRGGINDISVGEKKISGNAQARRKERILQHGTILIDLDKELMDSLIKIPAIKGKDRGIIRPSERVTSIKEILGYVPNRNSIIEALLEAFSENFGEFEIGSLYQGEIELGNKLAVEKYGRREWLLLK